MARYSGYSNYSQPDNNISSVTATSRNSEKVAEVNRNVIDMRSDILRLTVMVQAMMEIMAEQGVDPALINSKMEEIMARPETFDPSTKASKPCPQCGRMIMDNGTIPLTGTCLYCGTVVRFTPEFIDGSKKQNNE